MSQTSKLIWDIPTRLFHWLLVIGISAQWLTAEYLENAIDWHFKIGYCLLGLVLFRLIWGLVGTRYARFSAFVVSPKTTLDYAKTITHQHNKVYASHNPMGSWMVLSMLLLVLLQAISGLFVSDDVFADGPYRSIANKEIINIMETIHFNGFTILLVLIVLHVVAVLFYQFFKRQQLINAMITGKKPVEETPIPHSKLVVAVVTALLSGVVIYLIVAFAPVPDAFY